MAKRTFRKGAKTPLYKSPSAPAASRVKDLLARMTLEEKAAQMMCVWQEKAAETSWTRKGNFDFAEGKGGLQKRPRHRASWPPERRRRKSRHTRRRQDRARHGGADQRHPEIFHREHAARHSGDVSRGMPARPRGQGTARVFRSPSAWGRRSIPNSSSSFTR